MSESPDSHFLKVAVAKGLVDAELATSVYRDAQESGRPVVELLVERQVLTAYHVDLIIKDLAKASGPKIIAGFQIISKLGQGGMGAVYRATQLSIGREVALKVMAPDVAKNKGFSERFLREAMAMGAINHPNVITCFDAGKDGKILYMALELMTGGDADQLARSSGGILPAVRACSIVRDGAAGLGAIHKAGLIHRDIKPANIFLGENGTAKLADLGLARHEDSDDQMTRTGTAMGTPAFMSPEQAQGVDDLDIRSDIYALGATLFALSTGQAPFSGQSAYAIVARVINEPVPDPRSLNPNIPDPVVQVIRAAMQKDRKKRPQTPYDLQQMLHGCLDELLAAGLTQSTVGSLPASLVAHPTPHTHLIAGNSNRHHRTHTSSTSSTGRNWLLGAGIFFAIATAAIVGVSLVTHPSTTPLPSDKTVTTPNESERPEIVVKPPPKTTLSAVAPIRVLMPNDPWPENAEWVLTTSGLSSNQQLAAVVAALKQLNPRSDGQHQSDVDSSGAITSLTLSAKGLDDLRPLQALKNLHTLILHGGTPIERSPLYTVEPLRDLPLTHLALPWTMVEDLTPFQGKLLAEIDLVGSTVSDLSPILNPSLRTLSFSTDKVRRGVTALRALTTVETIGISWEERVSAATFWRNYDAGKLPGVEAVAIANEVTPAPASTATVATTLPGSAGSAGSPLAPESVKQPALFAIEALTIPETANAKVRAIAKTFNDSAAKLLNGLTQRRKEAAKAPLKITAEDYNKSSQGGLKDPSLITVAMAIAKAKFAIESGVNPRDMVFTDPLLPHTTTLALSEWRSVIEPVETEAANQAEERRLKALKDLEPFAADGKSGASELITQLKVMVPIASSLAAEVEPVPVPGAVWRIECLTALPHDTALRDLTGIHAPARVVGELGETIYGKALRGDGRTTQIIATLKKPLTARTLMAWVNVTHATLGGGALGLQFPDGTRYESLMFFGADQGWGIASPAAKRSLITGKMGYNEGVWRHVALTVDGTSRTLYFNGKVIGSDQGGEATFPAGCELVIGKRNTGRDERHFAGLIDGILVFDRVLNQNEIRKVMRWQSVAGDQIRANVREREWATIPVANSDFSKVTSAGRPAEWQARGDGISVQTDADSRFLHMDLTKVGQEARVAKQVIKLDPSWRAVRVQLRMRLPKALEEIPAASPAAGVEILFDDPTGSLPTLRRLLDQPEGIEPGTWKDASQPLGWPIPPGYTVMTIACTLRGWLGTLECDDIKASALVGKP